MYNSSKLLCVNNWISQLIYNGTTKVNDLAKQMDNLEMSLNDTIKEIDDTEDEENMGKILWKILLVVWILTIIIFLVYIWLLKKRYS